MRKVTVYNPTMGCDPEFFFTNTKGDVIGAEKVLPKEGMPFNRHPQYKDYEGKIIIDGVQAEINPRPNHCRANLANDIAMCMRKIRDTAKAKGVKVDLKSSTVEISQKELDSLDENNKKFGCAPSSNSYGAKTKISSIDPEKYRFRSAGGHIHLGHDKGSYTRQALEKIDKIVPMLDLLVGNTGVLIDRGNDEANRERRKVYGQAGEYRTPAHGLEYRTPSNFWLKSYPIMSLIFGLSRYAVYFVASDISLEDWAKNNSEYKKLLKNEGTFYDAFFSKVDIKDVQRAINDSDFDLALANWNKIEDLFYEVIPTTNEENFPLNSMRREQFEFYIQKNYDDSNHWFKEDPLEHWCNLPEAHTGGITSFLEGPVNTQLRAHKELLKKPVKKVA